MKLIRKSENIKLHMVPDNFQPGEKALCGQVIPDGVALSEFPEGWLGGQQLICHRCRVRSNEMP